MLRMEMTERTEGMGLPTCRVCFEEGGTGNLVSPCKCSGSSKYIHLSCLQKWQECVQKQDSDDERAIRCNVCRSMFTVPPPKPRGSARVLRALRGIGGAICITLLAFGLSGPPWPHLALLVLLLLGTRCHTLLALGLLLAGSVIAALHARGLRVVMRVDGMGRLGLAVIRHGAPVQGLGPGTLLVATNGLEHTMFRQSVVLLCEHGRGGAKGVVLTQALAGPPAGAAMHAEPPPYHRGDVAPLAAGEADLSGADLNGTRMQEVSIHHFLGGPVGMPGEGAEQELLLIHTVSGVPGAVRLPLQGPHASNATAAGAAQPDIEEGHADSLTGNARQPDRPASSTQRVVLRSSDGSANASAGASGSGSDNASAGSRSAAAGGGVEDGAGVAGVAGCSNRRTLPTRPGAVASSGNSTGMQPAQLPGTDAEGAASQQARAGASTGGQAEQMEGGQELYVGGKLADVLEAAGHSQGSACHRVFVYHGVCSWAEGQLEGEIRSGAWAFAQASLGDIAGVPAGRMWEALTGSQRLVRRPQQ